MLQQACEARGAAGADICPAEGEGRCHLGAVHRQGCAGGRLRGHEHPADHPTRTHHLPHPGVPTRPRPLPITTLHSCCPGKSMQPPLRHAESYTACAVHLFMQQYLDTPLHAELESYCAVIDYTALCGVAGCHWQCGDTPDLCMRHNGVTCRRLVHASPLCRTHRLPLRSAHGSTTPASPSVSVRP